MKLTITTVGGETTEAESIQKLNESGHLALKDTKGNVVQVIAPEYIKRIQ